MDDYYRLGAYLYKCRLESIVDGVDKINGTKMVQKDINKKIKRRIKITNKPHKNNEACRFVCKIKRWFFS